MPRSFLASLRTSRSPSLVTAVALATTLWAGQALADVPAYLPMTGYLVDGNDPIDEDVDLTIRLYDGDSVVFEEEQNVEVVEGNFAAYIGAEEDLDLTIVRDASSLTIGISVDGGDELEPRLNIGAAAYAVQARFCAEANTLQGLAAADFRRADADIDFDDLTGVPADLADGDADSFAALNCADGEILVSDGTSFGCATRGASLEEVADLIEQSTGANADGGAAAVDIDDVNAAIATALSDVGAADGDDDTLASLGCMLNEIAQFDGSDWNCTTLPEGVAYTAGSGLSLAGNAFSVDTASIQTRIGNTCPEGSAIRAIAEDGTVTCETDDNDNTQYTAGSGLSLAGTAFSVDTNAVQARVGSSCPAGSSIRVINLDGTVVCETDDDTNTDTDTTYSAGSGLALSGTTFSVNTAAIQARVTGNCPAGSSIRAIAANGAVTCESDTDTNTLYTAGSGMALSGTTFSVNTAAIQARVTGNCAVGSAIRSIAANGTVTCESVGGGSSTHMAFGDGSAGSLTVNSSRNWGTTPPTNRNYNFTNFTVNSGVTLTVPAGTIIRCTGTFTNNGTIVVSTSLPGEPSNNWGANSGVAKSIAGGDISISVGAGAAEFATMTRLPSQFGAPGGGASGNTAGGAGGGSLTVRANGAFTNTGIIRASGALGATPASTNPGGGGGGGGGLLLASSTSISNSGQLLANGAHGSNAGTGDDDGGGGGGGGGGIHLVGPNANGVGGTIQVSGGNGGSSGLSPYNGTRAGGGGGSVGNGGLAADGAGDATGFNGAAGAIVRTQVNEAGSFFF